MISSKLLQLMVYAKIIYLLMVVISGALCTVEDYVIMSQCAHNKAINLDAEGTVSVTDISQTQNITIVGRPDFVNNNFKIALYAKETQRYLCFNDHWKLVGMKELQDTCYFNEAIVHGYFVFRSVVDLQRRIGFTQRGRAVGPKKTVNDACYMFTKIPTDQFFHQHSHFPAPKTKSTTTSTTTTTTKIPKTIYTLKPNHSTGNAGKGSGSGGGGRSKKNRFRNPQRQEDTIAHNHSGHGSGGGSGNGHKKFKKQRNGNKQQRRQQQQQQQQLKQEMQQHSRGHSYNVSNPKNSTYLNSSRQNLVLSQHSHINNHTNRKYNNSNPPQNHQVRHHHNDPNKVARRQQHDQKQKQIKLRQRVRPNVANETSKVMAMTTTATATITTTAINSSRPHSTQRSTYSDINPTSVFTTLATDNQFESRNTMASSSVVVAKRKGRRRKGNRMHKKNLLKIKQERDQTREHIDEDNVYNFSSVGPYYEQEQEEEYMTSSTDNGWVTNDIMLSSVQPTSASLPSWETWYPSSSSSTLNTDEDTNYSIPSPSSSFPSSSTSLVTEPNNDKQFSTTLAGSSSLMTDLNKNTISPQQLQTSVPLPTSVFTATLTENSIDETISPTITTDLGMTTTNTSTYTQTDFWSTSPSEDNREADMVTNPFNREIFFNSYATPKLEDTQPTLYTEDTFNWEDTNTLSTQNGKDEEENSSTLGISFTTTGENKENTNEDSTATTDENTHEVSDSSWAESSTFEMTSSRDYDKSSEPSATTIQQTNECAYSTISPNNGSNTMTDCSKLATKFSTPIANNHKQGDLSPTELTIRNTKISNETITNNSSSSSSSTTTLNLIPLSTQKTTSMTEALATTKTTPQLSLQTLNSLQSATTLPFTNEQTEINSAPTTAFSSTVHHSTKTPEPTALTTRKTLRKSTQRLLATPFHQLTYVRNEAGDIDIDSIDNISIYPEILDNDNDEPLVRPSTSRLTMISGYLPTSATATLPESIRIAKIKINRERKRMLRLRSVGNYA